MQSNSSCAAEAAIEGRHLMTDPAYTCPKCFQTFEALFIFLRHLRESHQEPKGLSP